MKAYTFDLEGFAARHLGGNVENLAELSLGEIQVLPLVYGFSTLDSADCDDTNLAWEVYHRLWGIERVRESPPASPNDSVANTTALAQGLESPLFLPPSTTTGLCKMRW